MTPTINATKLVATAIATFASTDKFIIFLSIMASSGRFTRHGWRLHVYIDFLGLAAMTDKLAAKEKEGGGNDDQKDHKYGHDCRVAATTVIIRHKIHPPS
jgi:hypothetical protein